MRRLALIALLFAGCRSTDSSLAPAPDAAHTSVVASEELQVIALKNAGANELAGELRAVFGSRGPARGGYSQPSIIADERTNSLIVRASAADMAAIQGLVAKLDVRVESAGR